MPDSTLLDELVKHAAYQSPTARALTAASVSIEYQALQASVERFASALVGHLRLERGGRVAIYLEKRFEGVIASFGAPAAGGAFVPLNPLLKPEQVGYILRDCGVCVLITSPERFELLADVLPACKDLRHVVLTGQVPAGAHH